MSLLCEEDVRKRRAFVKGFSSLHSFHLHRNGGFGTYAPKLHTLVNSMLFYESDQWHNKKLIFYL